MAWCSQDCQVLGWEASHREFCSQNALEERKVRESWKKQAAAGRDWLAENIVKKYKDPNSKRAQMMKELCQKRGRSRDGTTGAQNQDVAAAKEGK